MTAAAPEPFLDLDWEPARARAFAERTVDLWEEVLGKLRDLPITHGEDQGAVRDAVAIEVPEEPMPEDRLFEYLREMVFEHSFLAGHPRFMAYITGAGTVPGAAADLLASGLNMNSGGWVLSPAATEIELHLTRWFARAFGLPETAGGILVSGGAMANFVALKAARDRRAGWDVRTDGVAAGPPLGLYLSAETHVVSSRAADMLGLGTRSVRQIPVDDAYRIRVDLLREAIARDREAGTRPFAVVGTAGTVSTGAIDPLDELGELCAAEDLWFHVDAAYGGPAVFTEDLRPMFSGIERADSIAFDPHKWMYTPHSGGCVLVRDLQHLADSFSVHATYVKQDKERTGRGIDGHLLGPQFSRGFQALKVWVSLLAHGRAAYGRRISHDAALARYLGDRAAERPDFELVTPVVLSICCFRYVPSGLPEAPGREEYLDLLNERLMTDVQQDGRVFFSNAVLGGRYVLRACIVNFRTEAQDLDAVLDVAAEVGARLDEELRPQNLRTGGSGGPSSEAPSGRRPDEHAERRPPERRGGMNGDGVRGRALGLLGAGEFDPWSEPVERWLLERARNADGPVLILPTASAHEGHETFTMWANKGLEHYRSIGVPAELVPIKTRDDAARPEFVDKLENAAMIYFSGGNPARLTQVLDGTPFWTEAVAALDDGLAYAGCSAGVAWLTEITYDSDTNDFESVWAPGLGYVKGTLFAPHWDIVDSWIPGAKDFIAASVKPGERLVAIDEDTAFLGDGRSWQVMGRSGVYVLSDSAWTTYRAGDAFELELPIAAPAG